MNVRQMSIAVAIVGCGWAAWAEGASNESIRISMELDLVDGSRLIGTPGIATVPVQTSYAKMDVPLTEIQALKIGADHETVTLDLCSGDTLTGVISLAPIKLEALFGPVSIGIEHIKQFTIVRTGGALPESLRKGLLLYYSFDRDEKEKVSDGTDRHNDAVVHGAKWSPQGKIGGAYTFDGNSSFLTVKPAPSMPTVGDFTVSLWTYVQARTPQVNGSGARVDRQYILDTHSDAESGQYQTGFFLVYDFNGAGAVEVHNGIHFDLSENGGTEQNTRVDVADKWHHLVFARRGMDDYTYLDGKLLDSTYGRRVQRNDLLDLNHTWSIGTFAGNIQRGSRQVNYAFKGRIDEVLVFTRALSQDDIEQLYDFQK